MDSRCVVCARISLSGYHNHYYSYYAHELRTEWLTDWITSNMSPRKCFVRRWEGIWFFLYPSILEQKIPSQASSLSCTFFWMWFFISWTAFHSIILSKTNVIQMQSPLMRYSVLPREPEQAKVVAYACSYSTSLIYLCLLNLFRYTSANFHRSARVIILILLPKTTHDELFDVTVMMSLLLKWQRMNISCDRWGLAQLGGKTWWLKYFDFPLNHL